MTATARWSLENIETIRAQIVSAPADTPAADRNERYHPAAAVVTRFALDPTFHVDKEPARNLIADSLLVDERDGRQFWSLKNEIRKRVLAGLRTRDELQRALQATPDRPQDPLQRTLESWIERRPTPLDDQSPLELSTTLQVVDWLETTEIVPELPAIVDVQRRVEHASLLQPFRDLVGAHFKGRTRELGVLRDYLAAPPTTGPLKPLLIHGPGGMGKSTLLSKFILDTIAAHSAAIMYLDCDRPGLVAEEPLTLLAEAVSQLGIQFPHLHASAARLRTAWLRDLAGFRAAASDTLESDVLESVATRDRSSAVEGFALFARELPSDLPVLLVIDTFEELQYRSGAFTGELFTFLGEMAHALPRLRIVISGRDDVGDWPAERLPLTDLESEAAEGYLAARGVANPALRTALARALHGNPLSLNLAATLVSMDTVSAAELAQLDQLVDDTQTQGVLYRRILGHLHDKDEELERIAHPGLILRRITPAIIRQVIAEPCGLRIDSDERARALLEKLRSELALVVSDGDAVRHRPDVRRVMLPALRAAERDRTDAIQLAAIRYYSDFDDAASRAEELYHRLLLGQPAADVDRRWGVAGVEDFLRGALNDLSGPPRAYLASRLHIELYDTDLDGLEPTVWERTVATRVESLIRLDRPHEALALVHGRAWRSDASPLYWLEARLLRQLGRMREARQVARTGIGSIEKAGRIAPEHLDLFILMAEADETLGGDVDWSAAAEQFDTLNKALPSDARRIRFALAYLRLAARASIESPLVTRLKGAALATLGHLPRPYLATIARELPADRMFDRFRNAAADEERAIANATVKTDSYTVRLTEDDTLRAALAQALPTLSDVDILMKDRLGTPMTSITRATTVSAAIRDIVAWANREHRLGQLASAALALNPSAVGLQRLLARETRIGEAAQDPFAAVLLPGGRPFFGRSAIRAFMRDLVRPSPATRVFLVLGPPGSGKSYTREYLSYLSTATEYFECGFFQMDRSWTIEDVVGSIHSAFKWRWANDVDRSAPLPTQVVQYANQVINKARRTRRVVVLFFDRGDEQLVEAVEAFVEQLARTIATAPVSMALVLSNFKNFSLTCRMEIVERLSKEELVAGLHQLAPATEQAVIDQIAGEILSRVPADDPQYNARVNRLATSYAASLVDASGPVKVFVSYASQDRDVLTLALRMLAPLQNEGLVQVWTDRNLAAGVSWREEIARQLETAEVVVTLATSNYLRQEYAKSLDLEEVARRGGANVRIIPVNVDRGAAVAAFPKLQTIEFDALAQTVREAALSLRARRAGRGRLE